jgi:hypothetical protein
MLLSREKNAKGAKEKGSTEMVPKEKMAFHGVDILLSSRKARAFESCAVKEEQARFHEVSWRS